MPYYKVKKLGAIMSPPNLAYISTTNKNIQMFEISGGLNTLKFANVGGLNGLIIKLEVSNRIEATEIELTPEHMSYLGVVAGGTVKVEPIPEGFYDMSIEASKIETLVYRPYFEISKEARHIETPVVPDLALVNYLKVTLQNQILYKGQKIAFNYAGREVMLVVDDISVKYEQRVIQIPSGALREETEITVEKFEKDRPFRPGVNPDEISKELHKRGIGGMYVVIKELVDSIFKPQCLPDELTDGLDIKRIRGVLLHGPPGTGKTLVARNFCELLLCAKPTIVAGPALKNKYHGESEKNIRDLFEKARSDYRSYGDKSPLHVFIFDEFDSIARTRTGDTTIVNYNDGLVNQLLTMMDGIEEIPNILMIGTTNRIEVIDPAMLRTGRFEKYVEVKYPTEPERFDILNLKTRPYASKNLTEEGLNLVEIAALTPGFSGSDLESVVSRAFSKMLQNTSYRDLFRLKNFESLPKIKTSDFKEVVAELKASKANLSRQF